ncbi:hypothetical protein LSH36_57g03020 [Paralvinella palmiformis]|uniref:Rieske domain-containing protein n=1 Tax=Paralvinella palmiformis TaxID=53620 RepID=A0AAD9K6A7_9ANNE|nr:hypothetical protein LSH36_57g03020 [Paralvinella palmiformis]
MSKLSGIKKFFGGKSSQPMKDEFVETVVCKVNEMVDGEMRQIDLGEGKALLVKDKGEFFAVGPKCSHFGAPLHKGAYCNGIVRCPWHGACFNVKTGDIEDFPGLDSIPHYEVKIEKDMVKVIGRKEKVKNSRRLKSVVNYDAADKRIFIVVGGGPAAASCVETLRQEGYTGRIVMISKEPYLPYDRTKLSKTLDAKPATLQLRDAEFYKKLTVELMTGKQVIRLDVKNKTVHLNSGESLHFDKVMCATGGSPRNLEILGNDLKNVHVLRDIDSGNAIGASCQGQKVVLIGTSFIGLELASYMLDKGSAASVTVVGRSEVPLKTVLGEKIGIVIKKLIEDRGGKFVFSDPPVEFLGVNPSTDYLKDSDVELTDEGYVIVNKQMMTNISDVFAAGDMTKFPLFLADDEHINIQHWQMAIKQGQIAGTNMAGKERNIHSVPFFWTMILGKGIRYAGSLEDYKFVAYYTKGDKVIAVATIGSDPVAAQAAEMFYNKIPFLKSDIINDSSVPPAWSVKLTKVRI